MATHFLTRFQPDKDKFLDSGSPTPVWHVVNKQHVEILKVLLDEGCDMTKPGPDGTSALLLAFLNENPSILKCIRSYGNMEEYLRVEQMLRSETLEQTCDFMWDLSCEFPKFNEDEFVSHLDNHFRQNQSSVPLASLKAFKPFCPFTSFDFFNNSVAEYENDSCDRECPQ